MERTENRELLAQLELCGHFLHHRGGGKHGQARILRMLREKGQLTQRELQEMVRIRPGSMSELVGKLEGTGLVLRERSEKDRRQVLLRISEEGEAALARHERENRRQEAQLFEALSPEEQRQLSSLLEKLLAHWRAQYDRALFNHKGAGEEKEEGKSCSNT